MTTQNFIALITVLACAGFLACAYFRDRGYQDGISDGYQQGRKDADDWWIGSETAIDQARQEMWKKGMKR